LTELPSIKSDAGNGLSHAAKAEDGSCHATSAGKYALCIEG